MARPVNRRRRRPRVTSRFPPKRGQAAKPRNLRDILLFTIGAMIIVAVIAIPAAMMAGFDGKPRVAPQPTVEARLLPAPSKPDSSGQASDVGCDKPTVTDGDTIRCGARRIRLASIDAPELPGHCRSGRACTPGDPFASSDNLRRMIANGPVECDQIDIDRFGRTVAQCSVAGRNLSCAQVQGGFAVIRYGSLSC